MDKHLFQNKTYFSNWQMDLRESRFKRIIEFLKEESPGRMLDIGCSSGDFVSGFAQLGWEPYGLDISENRVKEAQRKGVKAQICDVSEGLPFEDNFFRAVVAGEVIEHLVDTDSFIKEIFRVLERGGVVVVTTPNLVSLENRLRLLFGKYPRWVEYKIDTHGHVRSYTPQTLKKHWKENGFSIEGHVGNFVPPISQKIGDDIRWPWLAITGRVFPNLAMDIIIKARKGS